MDRGTLELTIARRFTPFVAVGAAALATIALPPAPTSWWLVAAATALTVAIAVAGLAAPWSRLPRRVYVVSPLAYLLVVALLSHAQGGASSGYAPLAALPVLWVALTLGRLEVAFTVIGVAMFFALPPALAADYPPSELRRAVLWLGVAGLIGFSTESIVRRMREQAQVATARAAELAASERVLAAVVHIARDSGTLADVRTHVCETTLDVTGATVAIIAEPDGDWLEVTAFTGLERPPTPRTRLGSEGCGSELALEHGTRLFVSDVHADPHIASRLHEAAPEIVTALFEPIQRAERTIGVLAVGWPERVDDPSHWRAQAVRLLAAETGAAIERADLLAQLSRLSLTDVVTGLPNRRAWESELPRALAQANRTGAPVAVGILDLDGFKAFNDTRGHQAGDALLEEAAAAWRASLREGDLLARYGGDEFAALLPNCTLEEASVVLERLRAATPAGQTGSIGLAAWDGHERGDELVARADWALYEAKRTGRNRLMATQRPAA